MMGSYRYESANAERKTISRKPVRRKSTFKPGVDHYRQVSEMQPSYLRDCSSLSNKNLSSNMGIKDKFLRFSCSAPTSDNARNIAYGIKRHIIQTKEQVKRSPNFVKRTHAKILYLHNYNCKVAQVCSMYPLDDALKDLLVKYIELEMSILNNIEYNTDVYRLTLERRLLTLLSTIYSKYCFYIKGRFNPSDAWQFVLELFEEVPYDVHKFFDDIRQKVIKKIDFGSEPLHTITVQSQLTCYEELDGTVSVEIDLENDPLLRCCEAFNIMPEVQELPVKMVLTDRHASECGDVIITDDELIDTGQDVKPEFDMFLPNLTERLRSVRKQGILQDRKPEIIDLCVEEPPTTTSIITKTNLRRNTVIDLLDSDSDDDDDSCQTDVVCPMSVGRTRSFSRKCDKGVDNVVNLIDDRCKNKNVISSLSSTVPGDLRDGQRERRDNGTITAQQEQDLYRQIVELNLLSGSNKTVIIEMINNKVVFTRIDNLNTSNLTETQALSSDKILKNLSSPVVYEPVDKDNIQPTIVDLCTEALSPRLQLIEKPEETNSTNILTPSKEDDTSHSTLHTNLSVETTEALSTRQHFVGEVEETDSINNNSAESEENASKSVNIPAIVEEIKETNSINNSFLNIDSSEAEAVIKDVLPKVVDFCTEPSSHEQPIIDVLEEMNSTDNSIQETVPYPSIPNEKTTVSIESNSEPNTVIVDSVNKHSVESNSNTDIEYSVNKHSVESNSNTDIEDSVNKHFVESNSNTDIEDSVNKHSVESNSNTDIEDSVNKHSVESNSNTDIEDSVNKHSVESNSNTDIEDSVNKHSVESNSNTDIEDSVNKHSVESNSNTDIVDSVNKHSVESNSNTDIEDSVNKHSVESNSNTDIEDSVNKHSVKSNSNTDIEDSVNKHFVESNSNTDIEDSVNKHSVESNSNTDIEDSVNKHSVESNSNTDKEDSVNKHFVESNSNTDIEDSVNKHSVESNSNTDIEDSVNKHSVESNSNTDKEDSVNKHFVESNSNTDIEDSVNKHSVESNSNTDIEDSVNKHSVESNSNTDIEDSVNKHSVESNSNTDIVDSVNKHFVESNSNTDIVDSVNKHFVESNSNTDIEDSVNKHSIESNSNTDKEDSVNKHPRVMVIYKSPIDTDISWNSSESFKSIYETELEEEIKTTEEENNEKLVINQTLQDNTEKILNQVVTEQTEQSLTFAVVTLKSAEEIFKEVTLRSLEYAKRSRIDLELENNDIDERILSEDDEVEEDTHSIDEEGLLNGENDESIDAKDVFGLSTGSCEEKAINLQQEVKNHSDSPQQQPREQLSTSGVTEMLTKQTTELSSLISAGTTEIDQIDVSSEEIPEDIGIEADMPQKIKDLPLDKVLHSKEIPEDKPEKNEEALRNNESLSEPIEISKDLETQKVRNNEDIPLAITADAQVGESKNYSNETTALCKKVVPEEITACIQNFTEVPLDTTEMEITTRNTMEMQIDASKDIPPVPSDLQATEKYSYISSSVTELFKDTENMQMQKVAETSVENCNFEKGKTLLLQETQILSDNYPENKNVKPIEIISKNIRNTLGNDVERVAVKKDEYDPEQPKLTREQMLILRSEETRDRGDPQPFLKAAKNATSGINEPTVNATDLRHVKDLVETNETTEIQPEIEQRQIGVEKKLTCPKKLLASKITKRLTKSSKDQSRPTKSSKDQSLCNILQSNKTSNKTSEARKSEVTLTNEVTESYDSKGCINDRAIHNDSKITDFIKNSKGLNIKHAVEEEVHEVAYEEGPVYLEEDFVDNTVEISTCEYYEECIEEESTNLNENKAITENTDISVAKDGTNTSESAGNSSLKEEHITKENAESELSVEDKNDSVSKETSDTSFSIGETLIIRQLIDYIIDNIEDAEGNEKNIEKGNVLESTLTLTETSQCNKKSFNELQNHDCADGDVSALSEEEITEAKAVKRFRNINEDEMEPYIYPEYTKEQMIILRNEETKARDNPATLLSELKNTTSESEDKVLNLSNSKNKKSKNPSGCGPLLNLTSTKNDKDDGKSGNSSVGNHSLPLNLATNNNIGEGESGSGSHNKETSVSSKKHGGSQESEVVQDRQQDQCQQNVTDVNRMELKPSDIPLVEKIASYLPKNGKKMENPTMLVYNAEEDPLQDLRQSLSKYGTVVIPKTNNQYLHMLAETALQHENINSDVTDQGSDSEGLLIDDSCISPEYSEVQSEVILSSESYLSGPNDFVLQIQNSFQTLLGSGSSNRRKSPNSLKNSVTLYEGDNSETMMSHRKILPKPILKEYAHVQNYPEVISKHTNRRPNILKKKPKTIPATEKKPYLQPKLIVLTEEPKLSRPKTKAEKKQMPVLEPSRVCVRSDSDDDIPLAQRVKSRTPSPKKAKNRYGTTGILIGRPETNAFSPSESKGIVKKNRGKSGDLLKNIRIENLPFEEVPTTQGKNKTLGKNARRKLGEVNKVPEKVAPILAGQIKLNENAVTKPEFPDVHSKLGVYLDDEKNDSDTRKKYRSKLRPRSSSGSELPIETSSGPAVDPVSQTVEPIGSCIEVKSTDLSNKEPLKRLSSSGKVRQRSATVDDENMFIVVDNTSPFSDKTLIAPKPHGDKASYVAKLRRKSGSEESHNLIDLQSVNTDSDSTNGKKLRTGSPRAKKEIKLSSDTFDQAIPTVKASRGRGRGRGRGRVRRVNERGSSLSDKSKNVKKNLANLNFIPISDPIDSSETLTSPQKPVKKPTLNLDLNHTMKPSTSKPMVTLNTPPEIKDSIQSPPLASSVPSATTPKQRYKREFKARIENGKIDVTTPKNLASADNKKSLFSNCKNTVEATTNKLIKVLQIDPTKLTNENQKGVVEKNNGKNMLEFCNNLDAEEKTDSIITNRKFFLDNTMENQTLPLAELKPSDVTEDTYQKTEDKTAKITDQPMNQPDTVIPENLTELHTKPIQNEESLQNSLLVDNDSKNKTLLETNTTVEIVHVLENGEENILPLSEVQANELVVSAPLFDLISSRTSMEDDKPNKHEPTNDSENNFDIAQDDSILDDLPLSQLKNITFNSKKYQPDLEINCNSTSTDTPTCHKTSKHKKSVDQKMKVNLELEDSETVAESTEIVKTITQKSSSDPQLKLRPKATVAKDTSINDEPLYFDHRPCVENVIQKSSLEQKEEKQLSEASVTVFDISDIQSRVILDPQSNTAAIQISQKDITEVAKISLEEENGNVPDLSLSKQNLEMVAKKDNQSETFIDQENVKPLREKEIAAEINSKIDLQLILISNKETVEPVVQTSYVEPHLDGRQQTNNDPPALLENQEIDTSTGSLTNNPLKPQQYATISVLTEEISLNKTSDSNDFDLVSIAQEAAKHACENFEEQGTYFDDSGSVVREDIHISIGSEVEVTDTFTGDKEKEHLEIQDKLLHLLNDNLESETLEMSQVKTKKAKAENINVAVEKSSSKRNKKDVAHISKSVDQSASTKKKETVPNKLKESTKSVIPSPKNSNLTLDDDSDSEVEIKKKYLDKSKRKERDVKQDERKTTRYEKPKSIADSVWKKSSREKQQDELVNDKYTNKQRSSRRSRSEERESRSSSGRRRSESHLSINSTPFISKSAINRDLKRREDKGRYSKFDRDKYNDGRSHSCNSHEGRYDKSKEKNKDESHKNIEKDSNKHESLRFKNNNKGTQDETGHHSKLDKNVNYRSKEDTQKIKKDARSSSRRTKSNEHKNGKAEVKLKIAKSCDRSFNDDKGNQECSNIKDAVEVPKDASKNIRDAQKNGLFILLNRVCIDQNTDIQETRETKAKKLDETKVEKSNDRNLKLSEQQKNSFRSTSESRSKKEIIPKQTTHQENKQKEVKITTSIDDGKLSETAVSSKIEKTQTRIEPKIVTSSSSIVKVFANEDTGDNSDVTDLLHDLEANDDNSNKVGYTPKDRSSSQTLETVVGKRKSIENDDSIIETTPVQPRKKTKIERSIYQKSLKDEFKQCHDVQPSNIEPITNQNEEKSLEPDRFAKKLIQVQECVKRIEELFIATEKKNRETAHNVPQKEQKELSTTCCEHPEGSDSNKIILEKEDQVIDSKEDYNSDKIRNEVDSLENENKKIIETLSTGSPGEVNAVFTEDSTTNKKVDIIENSLKLTEQKKDSKLTLTDGFVQGEQQLSNNVQESSVIKKETDLKPTQLYLDNVYTTSSIQQVNDDPGKETTLVNDTVKEVKMPKAEIKKEPVLLIPARRHGRTRVLAPRKNPSLLSKADDNIIEDKNVSRPPLAPEPIMPEKVSIEARVESGQLPQLVFLGDVAKPQTEFNIDIVSSERIEAHDFQSSKIDEPDSQKVTKPRPFQLTTDGEIIPITIPQIPFVSNRGNTEREQKRGREEDFSEQSDQSAKKRSVAKQSVQVTALPFEPMKLYNSREKLPVISNDSLTKPVEPRTVLKDGKKSDLQRNNLLAGLLKDDVPYFELSLVTEVTDRLNSSHGHVTLQNVSVLSQSSDKSLKSGPDVQQKQDLKTSQQIINETFAQYLGSSDLTPELQSPITISQIIRESIGSDKKETTQLKQNANESTKSSPNVNEDMFVQIPNYYRNPSPPEITNSSHLSNFDFRHPSPPVASSDVHNLPVLENFDKNINLDLYHVGSDTQRPQILPDFVENKDVTTLFGESCNVSQSNVGGVSSLSYGPIQGSEVRYEQIYVNNFPNNLVASTIHSPYINDLSTPVAFNNQQTINSSANPSMSTNIDTDNTQCVQPLPEYLHRIKDADFSKIKSEKESEFIGDKEHSNILPSDVKFLEEYPCASPEQVLPNFNRNETFKASPATSTISQHSENTSVSQHSETTKDTMDVNSFSSSSFQKGDHTYPKDVIMNWHNEDKNELNQNPTSEYVKLITEYDMDELELDLDLIDESSTPATGIFRHASSIPTDEVWPFGVEPDNPNKILTSWNESSKVVVEPQPQDYSTYYPAFSCLNNSLTGDLAELSQGSESGDLERSNIDLTDWLNVSDTTEMLSEEMDLEESMPQDPTEENKRVNTIAEKKNTSKLENKKKLPASRKNMTTASKTEKENPISSQPTIPESIVSTEAKPEQVPHLAPLSGVTTRSASKRDARETYVTPQTQSMHNNLRVKSIVDLKNKATKPSDNIASLNNKTLVLTNGVPGGVFTVNALLMKTNMSQPRTTNVANSQVLKQQQMTSTPIVSTSNSSQVPSKPPRMVAMGLPADTIKQKQLTIRNHDLKGKPVHLKVVNPTFLKIVNTSTKNTVESTTSAPPLVALQLENRAKSLLSDQMETSQSSDADRSVVNAYVHKNIKKSAPSKQEGKPINKKSPIIKSPEYPLLFETRTMTKKVKEALSQPLKRPFVEDNAVDAKKPCARSPASDLFDSLMKSPVSQVFKESKSDVKNNQQRDSKDPQSKNDPNQPLSSGHQSSGGGQQQKPQESLSPGSQSKNSSHQQNPNEPQVAHRQNLRIHPLGSQARSSVYHHSPKDESRNGRQNLKVPPSEHQSRSSSSQHHLKEANATRYPDSVSPGHQSRSSSSQHHLKEANATRYPDSVSPGHQSRSSSSQHHLKEANATRYPDSVSPGHQSRSSSSQHHLKEANATRYPDSVSPGHQSRSSSSQHHLKEANATRYPDSVSPGHQSKSDPHQRPSRDRAPPGNGYNQGGSDFRGYTEKRQTTQVERSRSVGSRWGSKSPGFNETEKDQSNSKHMLDMRSKSDYCKTSPTLATSPNGTLLFPELPHKIIRSPDNHQSGSNGKTQNETKQPDSQNEPGQHGIPNKPEEHKWRNRMITKVDPDWMLLPTQRLNASGGNSK